jgi:hypothetical protein
LEKGERTQRTRERDERDEYTASTPEFMQVEVVDNFLFAFGEKHETFITTSSPVLKEGDIFTFSQVL